MQWARGRVTRKGPRGGQGPTLAGFVDRLRTWHFILDGLASPGRVLSRGRARVKFGFVWLLRVWTKACEGPRDDHGLTHFGRGATENGGVLEDARVSEFGSGDPEDRVPVQGVYLRGAPRRHPGGEK